MLRNFPLSVVALAVVACLGAVSSHAASSGALATQVQKDVSSAGAPLKNGATAPAGVPVVTGANSRAELQLLNGTTVRVGQGSSVSFDGANLSLAQGSALFKLGGGKAKIATPSLKCAATAAVISAHCAKNYEAFFVIEGSAAVDGVNLKAGEGWVRENGNARKIAFDVKRMLETSFLVTKFGKASWVVQAFAAAAIQSELLAANRAQSVLLSGRAPAAGTGAAGKGHAASSPAVAVAARNSSASGTGTVASNGVVGVSGGTLSTNNWSSNAGSSGSISTGFSTTGVALTKTGSGVLNLSGTNTYAPLSTGTVNTNTTPITTGGGSVVINANSAVNVTHSQTLSNLTIADGVEVNFGDGTPFSDGTVRSAAALRSALPKR